VAQSDLFELVGAVQGRHLVIWLDRFADNAPVSGAAIDLDVGGRALKAQPQADRFSVDWPQDLPAGVVPVTITVRAGNDSDLLATQFENARPATDAAIPTPRASREASIPDVAGAILVAAVAGLFGWWLGHRRGRRQERAM
jgi:hypothetical protein